jgi:hypothetical protein
MKSFVCVICNAVVTDEFGNNPDPIKANGQCCDACDKDIVIPARIHPRLYEKEIMAARHVLRPK